MTHKINNLKAFVDLIKLKILLNADYWLIAWRIGLMMRSIFSFHLLSSKSVWWLLMKNAQFIGIRKIGNDYFKIKWFHNAQKNYIYCKSSSLIKNIQIKNFWIVRPRYLRRSREAEQFVAPKIASAWQIPTTIGKIEIMKIIYSFVCDVLWSLRFFCGFFSVIENFDYYQESNLLWWFYKRKLFQEREENCLGIKSRFLI